MPDYSTFGGLINGINKTLESTVRKDTKGETEDLYKQVLQEKVYSNDSEYENTETLMKSIVQNIYIDNGVIKLDMFNDPAEMVYDYPSWVVGGRQADMIVEWLDEGQDSPLYAYEGRDFIDTIQKNINKEFANILKKKLRQKGVNISG